MSLYCIVTTLCGLLAAVQVQGSSSNWNVDWDTEYQKLRPYYQEPPPEPFTNPGELLPQLTIRDVINATGQMWTADNLVEAMGHACLLIGPKLPFIAGGPNISGGPSIAQTICDPVLAALRNNQAVDAEATCRFLWNAVESLSEGTPPTFTENYEFSPTEWPFTLYPPEPSQGPFLNIDLTSALPQVVKDLYGLTSYEQDAVCPAINTVLNSGKSLPEVIAEFGIEYLKATSPQVVQICQSWDGIISSLFYPELSFGFTLSREDVAERDELIRVFNEIYDVYASALGYADREALCTALTPAVASTDPNDLEDFATNLTNNALDVLTHSDICIRLSNEFLELYVGSSQNITNEDLTAIIFQYTGFKDNDALCQFVASSFTDSTDSTDSPDTENQPRSNTETIIIVCVVVGVLLVVIVVAVVGVYVVRRGKTSNVEAGSHKNQRSGQQTSDVKTQNAYEYDNQAYVKA